METAPAAFREISDVGVFCGNLEPKSSFLLAPRVSGQLKKLLVEVGNPVSNGQIVAELDDLVYALELDKANTAVAVARAQAEIQLSYTKIKAEWEGGASTRIIAEKLADEGALLSSGHLCSG